MKKKVLLFFLFFQIMIILAGSSVYAKEITKAEDAADAKIGVMTGTTGERLAKARFPNAVIESFDDIMDAVTALKSGQLDAVISIYPTVLNVEKHNADLYFLPDPLAYEDSAIAVKKGNDELLSSLNSIIDELKSNGTLEDMKKRWFKKELTPYEEVEITLPTEGEVLRIGISATREPFSFIDEKGQVSGHDGELARRISAKLGRPVEFMDMKFSALIPALQSGKVDIIVSGMTATDERRKTINFTTPYFANAQMMLVKKPKDNATTHLMSTIDDISNKKVGVFTGTIHDAFVAEKYPEAEIFRFESPADMILSVRNEKIDVALLDVITARVLLSKNQDMAIFTDNVLSKPLGVGFNKNNATLRDKFNNFLKEIKSDGTYQEMVQRWCENDPEKAEMPSFENPTQGEKIVVGVAVADLPYVAYMNGQYVGFDIEMLQKFAERENLSLEFMTMEFSSLVAALSSGKVDMIADGIAITEERSKQIDFSDSYLDFKTAAIALKKNIAGMEGEVAETTAAPSLLQSIRDSFYNNIILENRYVLILNGLKITIIISILATIVGTLLGALICFMRMTKRKLLPSIAMFYISALRGTPVLVLLMLIFYVVFASVNIDPVFVAVIAFGMNFAAYVSEMFRTAIQSIDKGQKEAGIASGFTNVQTFIYIIMPQAIKQVLPVYKGEFISLVKMTSIVGYIAVQDLTKASDIIRSRTFDAFFPLVMVAVLYFLISWILSLALDYVNTIMDPKAKRKQVRKA